MHRTWKNTKMKHCLRTLCSHSINSAVLGRRILTQTKDLIQRVPHATRTSLKCCIMYIPKSTSSEIKATMTQIQIGWTKTLGSTIKIHKKRAKETTQMFYDRPKASGKIVSLEGWIRFPSAKAITPKAQKTVRTLPLKK